jgi:hypothetical protein
MVGNKSTSEEARRQLAAQLTSLNQAADRRPKIAILDDYAALALADWSPVLRRADVTVFDRHLSEDEAAEVLQ